MRNKIQLITYVNRLGEGTISDLNNLLLTEFEGLFGGVHLLPFFYPIDGTDAGFDPIDHTAIDERLGDWNAIKKLTHTHGVMSDLIVNHISSESPQFKDYLKHGNASEFADLILTKEKVFPEGAPHALVSKIYRPRPGLPFTEFQLSNGASTSVWTTFTSNQIDIDVTSEIGSTYLEHILDAFQEAGITMIRLDAAGYAIKKAGTSCFMIEETFDFIGQLTKKAQSRNIEVLVEIHSFYKTQIEIAKRVDYVYDFALPVLVLDCLFNTNATNLVKWLEVAPRNVITVLDTHDGIGIVDVAAENDRPGLIPNTDLDEIVEQIHANSKGTSRKATGAAASNLDLYQVNCTYFDALGQDENAYLMARAIQFFVPGIPQLYYVGLLAGANDMELLAKTNVGRDINRQFFTQKDISEYVQTDFFASLKKLMVFRNGHAAFNGAFELLETPSTELRITWTNEESWATLVLNLKAMTVEITFSMANGKSATLF